MQGLLVNRQSQLDGVCIQLSLAAMGLKLERDSQKVGNSPMLAETTADMLIDGTERRLQCPKDGDYHLGLLLNSGSKRLEHVRIIN